MTPIPLMVELCAGTAALSLRLHRDGARPPVSRMGAKTGYADTILRVLGIVPGQRAERYLWCEPDAGVRLLLAAYADGALAKTAADIIRGWAGEDPRALWERLRAEGPVRDEGAGEVARWLFVQRVPGRGAEWGATLDLNGNGGCDPRTGQRFPFNLSKNTIPVDTLPTLPAAITPDARAVDPREVARWARIVSSNRLVNLDPMTWQNTGVGGSTFGGADFCTPAPDLAANFDTVPTLPALTLPDARAVDPGPDLPPGTVAYMDPPYQGTTGYGHDLSRPEVVTLARRWADAGAVVCISEAEPIPELVTDGWHAVRIDGERVGQKRTFSRQQAEYLTINRGPAWVPSVQRGLFA